MQEFRNGPTLFDKMWVTLMDRLLSSKADAHALEVKFPSVLDVCPTIAMHSQQIADVIAGSLKTAVSIGEGFGDRPDRMMAVGVDGGVTIYLHPLDDTGEMNVNVEAAELSVMRDLPNVGLWVSQITLTRLAYTKAKPGGVRMFIGTLRLGDEADQKRAMGVMMDYPIDKMPLKVRRRRNTVYTGNWPPEVPHNLVDEYDAVLNVASLMSKFPAIIGMKHKPFFQHTLAMDALRCLLSNQRSTLPFPDPLLGETEDEAVKALLERRLIERPR